jgi:hypothetical protein
MKTMVCFKIDHTIVGSSSETLIFANYLSISSLVYRLFPPKTPYRERVRRLSCIVDALGVLAAQKRGAKSNQGASVHTIFALDPHRRQGTMTLDVTLTSRLPCQL